MNINQMKDNRTLAKVAKLKELAIEWQSMHPSYGDSIESLYRAEGIRSCGDDLRDLLEELFPSPKQDKGLRGMIWAVPVIRGEFKGIQRRYKNTPGQDHITLCYDVVVQEYANMVGVRFSVLPRDIVYNGKVEAMTVRLPEGIRVQDGRIPHITLSWEDGSEPKDSRAMLNSLEYSAAHYPNRGSIQFEVVAEFFKL